MRALRVCSRPGCGVLVARGYCPEHKPPPSRTSGGSSDKRLNGFDRRRLNRAVLRDQPWCAAPGCNEVSVEVDHRLPISQGGAVRDRRNLQGLCVRHHKEKSAAEAAARAGRPTDTFGNAQ